MRFRDLFDLSIGALKLPQRPLPGENGNAVLDVNRVRVKGVAGVETYLLSNLDLNVPNGVPQLDSNGVIPASLLPPESTAALGLPCQVIWYSGDPVKIPVGYLVLNGSEQLRSLFPRLAEFYGSMHGMASSDLYFRLPNFMKSSIIGAEAAYAGSIGACHVVDRGTGYSNGTFTFTFTGGTAVTAGQGVATISGGQIRGIRILTGGDYTSMGAATGNSNCAIVVPETLLGPGSGLRVQIVMRAASSVGRYWVEVDSTGSGYGVGTTVVIGGSIIGAQAHPVMDSAGRILHVIISDPGTGDLSAPTVTIVPSGGSGGALSLNLSYDPALMSGDSLGAADARQHTDELASHTHTYSVPVAGGGSYGDGDGNAVRNPQDVSTSPAPATTDRLPPMLGAIPLVLAE